MDLTSLRELMREVQFGVHGVEADVLVPGASESVPTLVIWLTAQTQQVPAGEELTRAEAQEAMAIRRDDVPAVPIGTRITAPRHLQATPTEWVVDSMLKVETGHYRVIVVPYVAT